MDKKLLEMLEEAIKMRTESLNKDKTDLEAEITNQQTSSFTKTYIQEEFEGDLAKVEAELAYVDAEKEELKSLVERETQTLENIEMAKSAIESLNKDKEALEEEIYKLQGVSELRDGKLNKTTTLEKYEVELRKVLSEIGEKEQIITEGQIDLEQIQDSFQKLTEKYHIKAVEEKPQEEQEDLEERKKQEEEMWKEYENENSYSKEQVEAEIDKAYEEKAAEESEKERQEQKDYDEEIAVYTQILDEQRKKAATTQQKAQMTTPTRTTVAPQSQTRATSSGTVVSNKSTIQNHGKPTESKETWKVKEILFCIKDGNRPCYVVNLTNGDEKKQEEFKGEEYLKFLTPSESYAMTIKEGIKDSMKYYDKGLATILEDIDKNYGTSSLTQYKYMLKNRELILSNPDKYYKDMLDIDYNFSELFVKSDTKEDHSNMRKLKKIARANYNEGLANYEKAPNFLQKFFGKMKQKLLPQNTTESANSKETTSNMNKSKQEANEDMEYTSERILQDFESLHDEPGFDIEEFIKNVPESAQNKYRRLYELYQKTENMGGKAAANYRAELKRATIAAQKPKDDIQIEVEKNVKEIVDNSKGR